MMQEEGRETRKVKWQKKTSTEGGVGGYRQKIIIMKNNKKNQIKKMENRIFVRIEEIYTYTYVCLCVYT